MPDDQIRALIESSLADRYRIEGEAGAGGMATVYVAQDIRHDRRVAIKVLHPELSAMLGGERFLAEIKTTAALQHPHILPLFDSGSADGHLFYVMPFVEGETLRARLAREKQLPVADAVRIAQQVASALDHAHRRGVVHRDIKPENILLQDGQALVADFGIAIAVQSAGGQRMTQTGLSLGTPQYMSPEQAMGEREITARSDVYALGAIAYEMLAGEPPFSGPTAQAIVAKIMTEVPRPLAAQRKSIPPHVEAAILTALEKIPADRFGSAAEFAAALSEHGALKSAAVPVREQTLSRRWVPWAAAVVALGVGVAAGRLLTSPRASQVQYTQKTFDETVISLARYAPDGKTLVFSAAPQGNPPELYVIRPDYLEPQPVAQQPLHLLSVSSGGELAVLTRPSSMGFKVWQGTLARMPIGGGAPRELVDSVRDADWAPDGAQLAIIRSVGAKDRLEYPAGKVLVESEGWLSDPRFSPDGAHIAFAEHPWKWDDRGTINVVDLQGHRTVLSAAEYSKINGIAWARGGKELFFTASTPGAHQELVTGVTLDGKLRNALNGPGHLVMQDIAADGGWLVTRDVSTVRLFVRTAVDSTPRSAGWLDHSFRPVISHDGALLAFGESSSESGVNYSVMMRDMKGGKAIRLGEGFPAGFSADRRWLLSIVPSRPARLVIYPTGAGTERIVPTDELEAIDAAGWGHAEQTVWYCGTAKGKARVCRLRPAAGGAAIPIDPGAIGPSPDGRFAIARDGPKLVLMTTTGDTLRVIPGTEDTDRLLRWSPDGRALWVGKGNRLSADAIDIATGVRTSLIAPHALITVGTSISRWLVLADDPRTYAFLPYRAASELFLVAGMR